MSLSKKKTTATSTGFLLWQAGNAWQRKMKLVLDPVDLTHVQYLLLDSLEHLSKLNHAVTQIKLSRLAGIDVMMTSKVIRLLEKKKLVTRKSNKTDARVFVLELTREGSRSLSKAKNLVTKSEDKLFSKLLVKQSKFEKCLEEIAAI